MINKFNFYDVYGYFLPGLALLGLLWLPFGVTYHVWPSGELVTALIAIPCAYIAGHVVQTIAVPAFPSNVKDTQGRRRYPSDIILDLDDQSFSREFKERLADRIKRYFEIDVVGEPQNASGRRQDAFFLCRSVLIRDKMVSYGEQFEGLCALMRGLGASFLLGLGNYIGWVVALTGLDSLCLRVLFSVVLLSGIVAAAVIPAVKSRPSLVSARITFFCVALAALSSGYIAGIERHVPGSIGHLLFVIAATLFLALRCFGAYGYFAKQFALAIYRDFLTYERPKSTGDQKD